MRFALIVIAALAAFVTGAQAKDPHCRSVRVVKDAYWAGVAGPIYAYQCDGKQGRARKRNAPAK